MPASHIAAPVQDASSQAIERSPAFDLADFLNRRFGSVHVNGLQGNRFQPDVQYRGYTASPLLGTPQGLSVYVDGVRLNQPFGDTVSWDLLPRSAIASLSLVPGSNPLFGLNTLGGALSLQTKDGRSHPGTSLQVRTGSHGLAETQVEHGGRRQELDWFVTGVAFNESGWRDASPSRVGQIFGKLGWQSGDTDIKLTYAHADATLAGNGLQEERLLQQSRSSVYTRPDLTASQSHLVNLAVSQGVNESVLLSGNAYWRKTSSDTFNADLNDQSLDQSVLQPSAAEQAALARAGYAGFPVAGATAANTPFPRWRCIANVLLNDEPGEKCNALINRTSTVQSSQGFSGQASLNSTWAGFPNQGIVGAALDESRARFSQSSQLGYLAPDRSVIALPAFADGGATGGNVDGAPFDNRVDLDARTRTASLFATDTLTPHPTLHFSVSGRHNRTSVRNADRLRVAGPTSLDGEHLFQRLNPAAGVTYTPLRAFNAYLGYNEGSRAPSAIELGCANPLQPCRLPNSMAGDPPLRQVVTRTWETGVRGTLPDGSTWNAGVFRAENTDDILFVAAPNRAQFGYFRNVGRTRREGLELGWSRKSGALLTLLNYGYVQATFQSTETLAGSANSSNDAAQAGSPGLDGNIQVRPGDRLPLVPQQTLKGTASYAFTSAFSMDLNVVAVGRSFARGNENNADQPDGVRYLGSGRSPGYAVMNFGARQQVDRSLTLLAQVDNLFDRRYSSASLLGPAGFDASGNFMARPLPAMGAAFPVVHSTFQAPGAPRMAWVGMRYAWP